MEDDALLYRRELPGGGSVAIESLPSVNSECRARVRVERRCDPRRREGHAPPVIAEVAGDTPAIVLDGLYRLASDNVAIAREIIRWQSRGVREGASDRDPLHVTA